MRKLFFQLFLSASLLAALPLASCAPEQPPPPVITVALPTQPAPTPDSSTIAFFDSDAFDSSLAGVLSTRAKDVHVTFAGTTSVNAMPPRINAWLAEVKKSDGQVVAKDPTDATGSRGLNQSNRRVETAIDGEQWAVR